MLAYVVRYVWQWFLEVQYFDPYRDYLDQQLILTALLALTFRVTGVWRRRRGEGWLEEAARIVTATAAGITLMMAVTFFLQPSPFSPCHLESIVPPRRWHELSSRMPIP